MTEITIHLRTSILTPDKLILSGPVTCMDIKHACQYPIADLRFVHGGRILKDNHKTLESYSVRDGDTIHVAIRCRNE